MNRILTRVMCDFVKLIMLLLVGIISLSSLCKRKPEEKYLEPVNVSNNFGRSENPSIAVDSRNTVHLVWNDDTPGNEEIFYAIKPSNGSWSEPVQVTYNIGASRYPCIVIDRTDKIHLVWQQVVIRGNFSYWEIFYSWRFLGDTWAIPETLSIYGASLRPVLAVDNDLGLHLFWKEGMSPDVCHHYYAYKPQGGQWEIRYLFTSPIANYKIKVDKNKGVHIVVDIRAETYYIEKKPDGTWTDTLRISRTPTDWQLSGYPDLAIGDDCSLHIVWHESDTTLYGFVYVKRTPQGSWSTPVSPYKDVWGHDKIGIPYPPKMVIGKGGKIYIVIGVTNVTLGHEYNYYGVKDGECWKPLKVLTQDITGSAKIAISQEEKIHCALSHQVSHGASGDNYDIFYFEFKP